MPEDMPEDMPEHLPEDMPEHLPEDMPFLSFGGVQLKARIFPSLVGRLLDLSPSVVRFVFCLVLLCFPLCGLRSLLVSHPPWPQEAYRSTGQSKIVTFFDPIPFW